MREKINEHFLKQHFKVDKDSVAIMKHRSDVQHYGRMNYNKIIKFIKRTDLKNDSNIIYKEGKLGDDATFFLMVQELRPPVSPMSCHFFKSIFSW